MNDFYSSKAFEKHFTYTGNDLGALWTEHFTTFRVWAPTAKSVAVKGGAYIASSATSYEEIGNPVHRGTARILDGLGISYSQKRAVHLEKSDYKKYDYAIIDQTGYSVRVDYYEYYVCYHFYHSLLL